MQQTLQISSSPPHDLAYWRGIFRNLHYLKSSIFRKHFLNDTLFISNFKTTFCLMILQCYFKVFKSRSWSIFFYCGNYHILQYLFGSNRKKEQHGQGKASSNWQRMAAYPTWKARLESCIFILLATCEKNFKIFHWLVNTYSLKCRHILYVR